MDKKICQSCGMPFEDVGFFGTNEDETLTDEYCIYCYAFGAFNDEMTMEDMIKANLEFAGVAEDDDEGRQRLEGTRQKMLELYPTLKRWRQA